MSTDPNNPLNDLAYANEATGCKALYRQQAEHFQVVETLNFKPSGEGEHLYLYIKKSNTNTDWLARDLARRANLNPLDVGYAGRKDRLAVTTQWFSLLDPQHRQTSTKMSFETQFKSDDFSIIQTSRHNKKLRKGEIAFNRFKLQLLAFEGCIDTLTERVKLLSRVGFPNYFGPQRFGHDGSNIANAQAMLSGKIRVKDRNKRSIYLSSARSYLFNKILSARIQENTWQTPIDGDCFWDNQTQQLSEIASIENLSESELYESLNSGNLTITGAMAGDGNNLSSGLCNELESRVLNSQADLYKGIANSRINWQRRPLRVIPSDVNCSKNDTGVELNFSLQTGAYATSLLRELITIL